MIIFLLPVTIVELLMFGMFEVLFHLVSPRLIVAKPLRWIGAMTRMTKKVVLYQEDLIAACENFRYKNKSNSQIVIL